MAPEQGTETKEIPPDLAGVLHFRGPNTPDASPCNAGTYPRRRRRVGHQLREFPGLVLPAGVSCFISIPRPIGGRHAERAGPEGRQEIARSVRAGKQSSAHVAQKPTACSTGGDGSGRDQGTGAPKWCDDPVPLPAFRPALYQIGWPIASKKRPQARVGESLG